MKRVVDYSALGILGIFLILYFLFNSFLSNTLKTIVLSFIAGLSVFMIYIFIWEVHYSGKEKQGFKESQKRKNRRIIKNYVLAFAILIFVVIIFLNFYLYIQALVGNDLFISLKMDKENLVLKNGETGDFNVKMRVLTNPFCRANCSLSLEDLSDENIINYEYVDIKFSSPVSKMYSINVNEDKSGQKLYRVSLECRTLRSIFCYVNNEDSKLRTNIISIDHLLNDSQESRKEELRSNVEFLTNDLLIIQNNLKNTSLNYYFLNLYDLKNSTNFLLTKSYDLSYTLRRFATLYENQEYNQIENELSEFNRSFNNFNLEYGKLNSSIYNTFEVYNSLVDELNSIHDEILFLEVSNLSNASVLRTENFLADFNEVLLAMEEYNTLEEKISLVSSIEVEKNNLISFVSNDMGNLSGFLEVSIPPVDIQKVYPVEEDYNSFFVLGEPSSVCCLRNECYSCLKNSSVNYPIIFVHGHRFNEKISSESAIETFNDMAKKLEEDSYLNAGYFYGSRYDVFSQGYLGKINNSVTLQTTYYLDTLDLRDSSFILNPEGGSIYVYAERLNEIILNIKYLTGKDKVIVIAHSMGGLVTRRYMQLYGTDDINKVILLASPNKGINGFVFSSCSVFGANTECDEMKSGSEFILDLDNSSVPNIPVYNIIGLGCAWEGAKGDGIVKNESAYLSYANNIYVEGKCNGIDFFHNSMVKPSEYPEVYSIIKEILLNNGREIIK